MLDVLCVREMPRPRGWHLEIPADDVLECASFYGRVFGWETCDRESDRPRFVDPAGDVVGTWVAEGAGRVSDDEVLFDLRVDDVEETMARVWRHGGEVVEPPRLDDEGGQWVATFRDPSGNLIGLYQDESRA